MAVQPILSPWRRDPFERADIDTIEYYKWMLNRAFMLVPIQAALQKFIMSFKEYPPRQKPAKFNVEAITATLDSFSAKLRD